MLEARGQALEEKEGKGVQAHLVDLGGEGVRRSCEGERLWAGFYAGPRGVGQPLRMTAFCSKQLLYATAWRVMRWGVFSFPQRSLFMSSS